MIKNHRKMDLFFYKMIGGHITLTKYIPDDFPFQCFIHSRQGHYFPGLPEKMEQYKGVFVNNTPRLVHSSYVTVPWSESPDVVENSIKDIKLVPASLQNVNIPNYLVHLPASIESCSSDFIKNLGRCFDALESKDYKVTFILENSAHKPTKDYPSTGVSMQAMTNLSKCIESVSKGRKWGFCFDTAHAFSQGIPLTTKDDSVELLKWLNTLNIKFIHLNGNYKKFGGGVDKHALPGQADDLIWGSNKDGLKEILKWAEKKEIPMIVEAIGYTDPMNYSDIITNLKKLMNEK